MLFIKKVSQIIFIVILVIFITFVIFLTYIYYDTKPVLDGIIEVDSISNSVEIIRDDYGIPHIFARDDIDAYFGLGYAMAQDKLWQMDLIRRMASGTLSEILGKDYIEYDKKIRTLLIYEQSKQIAELILKNNGKEHYVKCMLSFINGINTYLKQIGNDLPLEFRVLSYNPEVFKFHDLYAVAGLIRYSMSIDKLMMSNIIYKFGVDKFCELGLIQDLSEEDKAKLITIASKNENNFNIPLLWSEIEHSSKYLPDLKFNSFAYAIPSSKTLNGKPILFNNVSISNNIPSILYEAHIATPQQNFYGVFLPLSPFGLIGHNQYIAWGVANSLLDDTDYYTLEINPENPNQYKYNEEWKDFELIENKISSRNENINEEFIIKKTDIGPVISEIEDTDNNKAALIFKWAYYDYSTTNEGEALDYFKSLYIINHSENFPQFVEGLEYYNGIGFDFVYADIFDNIANVPAGKVPKRIEDVSRFIFEKANSNEDIWKEFYPFSKDDINLNPENSIIISTNNINENKASLKNRYYVSDYREDRLKELIAKKNNFKISDSKKIFKDNTDNIALKLLPTILEELRNFDEKDFENSEVLMLELLEDWNYKVDVDRPESLIFNELYRQLLINTLIDEFEINLLNSFLSNDFYYVNFSKLIIKNKDSEWFDNINTPEKEQISNILKLSLKKTYENLSIKYGKNVKMWKWGNSHYIKFNHILGNTIPYNIIFNTSHNIINNSQGTVNKSTYSFNNAFEVSSTGLMNMIIDMKNPFESLFINAPGNSGHFHSENYKNQLDMLFNRGFRNPTNNKKEAYKVMKNRIKLIPL